MSLTLFLIPRQGLCCYTPDDRGIVFAKHILKERKVVSGCIPSKKTAYLCNKNRLIIQNDRKKRTGRNNY